MSKRVKAAINPDVLQWARESAAYTPNAAAQKMGIEEDVLSAWESGEDQPSVPQLRRLADIYRRPLAVLYLPERPSSFRPMHDFRRLDAAQSSQPCSMKHLTGSIGALSAAIALRGSRLNELRVPGTFRD